MEAKIPEIRETNIYVTGTTEASFDPSKPFYLDAIKEVNEEQIELENDNS